MGRLVDADKLIEFIDVGHLRHPSELCYSEIDVKNLLLHAPTVDAVPVVRCSECKNLEMINNEGMFAKCNKHDMLFLLWEDDIREKFCSWGEVREDGKVD